MARATLLSRIAFGASGALIVGAAALAQTSPPAPAPATPAASQLPPTATITTPGYPAAGPADPKLRIVGLPNGKKVHLLPATLETTQWGWFDNAQPPVLRVNSGDTIVLETMMHSHNQVTMHHRFQHYGVAGIDAKHRRLGIVEPAPLGGFECRRQQMHLL